MAPREVPGTDARERFTPYQRKLFFFISVACFFEGFDFFALSQVLPNIQREFALADDALGWLVAAVNLGTVLAYVLVRRADRWGRKRVLTLTIAGYTLATFLTGFSPNASVFALLQLVARVFLLSEWAICMVIAAEEFPASRRGMAIGVVSGATTLGSIVCAGVVPSILASPLFGEPDSRWRFVYFVGILPLLLLIVARRGLRETERFTAARRSMPAAARPLTAILRTPYRRRVLQLGLIWALTYVTTQTGVMFWKLFAQRERGFTDAEVGKAIIFAAVVAMPLVFFAGKLLDLIGRRRGAVVIYGLGALGFLGCYTLHGFWPLTAALTLGVFSVSAVLPVLNAYTTELFPTELRGDAFAWANNLLGRIGYVLAPPIVGAAASQVGWGPAVGSTVLSLLLALVAILWLLPETKDRTLEETAALDSP